MNTTRNKPQAPKGQEPVPPYSDKPQRMPGSEQEMTPQANHGEDTYVGSRRLQDRAALITGADSGIGRAVALAFAREGADVLISYLSEETDALETARLVTDAGRTAVIVGGDIADEAYCKALVNRAVREFWRLDIPVNNAAHQKTIESIRELTAEDLEYTFKTNIFAQFYLAKAALPYMKSGDAVINTASIQAYQPDASLIAYAATKAAIVNFTKALAQEAIKTGIHVNAGAPGPVWTPLIPSTLPPEKMKMFGQDTLIGRAAQPTELAPISVLLASQDGATSPAWSTARPAAPPWTKRN